MRALASPFVFPLLRQALLLLRSTTAHRNSVLRMDSASRALWTRFKGFPVGLMTFPTELLH